MVDTTDKLAQIGHTTEETEFYTQIPEGYKLGKTKYVIVLGTVMSGLGKGIFASSLAKCLQNYGLKVAPIKLEGYLNIDSGTLNPYRHGEVFVLDDGLETDMDLGTYERMLDTNLSKLNFMTSGQVFTQVLGKERKGDYLGRDVQMIPHVTGEVKARLRELAVKSQADIVFIEIGGTVGDVENAYYIEAMRELAFEEGPNSCVFVALTYIISPPALGEQKSKAAQLGIRRLLADGVQPHIVACRCHDPITRKIREKVAMYSNVRVENVISMHDCNSIYSVPTMLRDAQVDTTVLSLLNIEPKLNDEAIENRWAIWQQFVSRTQNPSRTIKIGIAGKYTEIRDSYASILHALEHAGAEHNCHVEIEWVNTEVDTADSLTSLDGLIVPGGFGARGSEGKIACIRYAREHKLPYLGICYGFQMAVVEFARNVCKLDDANSTEISPGCKNPVIDILPEQKQIEGLGANMRLGLRDVKIKRETIARELFGQQTVPMRFRHRYEVDPRYIGLLENAGMVFSGKAPDPHQIMQILELPSTIHPYFLATQAHPEFQSRPSKPHPFFSGLVRAACCRT